MLRTNRLLMRPWRPADRPAFARMNADPEVMEFFVAPLTREESDTFVDWIESGLAEHGFGVWAVEEISTGTFIGFTGLLHQTFEAAFTPAFEIGYRFARHAWGQGYATEAADRLGPVRATSLGIGHSSFVGERHVAGGAAQVSAR